MKKMPFPAVAALVVCGVAAWPCLAGAAGNQPPSMRIEGNLAKPLSYTLDLTILPRQNRFTGSIDVDLEILRETKVIRLNATDLDVSHASLDTANKTFQAVVTPAGEDFVDFEFGPRATLSPGPARLHVSYAGKLQETSTTGIFRQKVGEDWYAFTQFEAIDARRAFPCFDEPSYKVPWRLTLRVPKGDVAVANTPQISEEPLEGGLKAVRFAQSRPLPSYLVAFGVGPFEIVDAGRAGKNQTPIRMIVPRGRGKEARWAAETTGKLVGLLEDYFGIPYPYEKLDNMVIPQTVGFGAMENAGLVTYSESILLATPDHETPAFRLTYAAVCAHETAHQWFGDLVTLAWWNDVWLNESFATWMSGKVLEKWKPEWDIPVRRTISRAEAMRDDMLVSARRIRQPVESKGDIENAFDNISYGKGSAVLSMFESWLGEEKFRAGVRRYLMAHAYANASAEDFLAAFDEEAGPELGKAFSTFLNQAGVPVLTASMSCGERGSPQISLSQRRLLPKGSPPSAPQVWSIPVCVRYGGPAWSGRTCELMTSEKANISLQAPGCPSWLLADAGERGYYGVVYDERLEDRLLSGGAPELTLPERVGVLEDVSTLADAGQMPWIHALAFVPEFAGNSNPHVVASVVRIAQGVGEKAVPEGRRVNYERFVEKTLGPRARGLGWNPRPGEDPETQLLRPRLVGFVARVGRDSELRQQAHRLAIAWLGDPQATGPDTLGDVLAVAAEDGDRALFERFRAHVGEVPNRRDRSRLYAALGCFANPGLEKEALDILLSDQTDIRESFQILRSALSQRETREMAWDFFKTNFDGLVGRLPPEMRGGLPRAAAVFCDSAHRADVERFFHSRVDRLTGATRPLAETLETIDQCVALRADQSAAVGDFLTKF